MSTQSQLERALERYREARGDRREPVQFGPWVPPDLTPEEWAELEARQSDLMYRFGRHLEDEVQRGTPLGAGYDKLLRPVGERAAEVGGFIGSPVMRMMWPDSERPRHPGGPWGQMVEDYRAQARGAGQNIRAEDGGLALAEAYRAATDEAGYPPGMVGTSEAVFDPFNFVPYGAAGRAARGLGQIGEAVTAAKATGGTGRGLEALLRESGRQGGAALRAYPGAMQQEALDVARVGAVLGAGGAGLAASGATLPFRLAGAAGTLGVMGGREALSHIPRPGILAPVQPAHARGLQPDMYDDAIMRQLQQRGGPEQPLPSDLPGLGRRFYEESIQVSPGERMADRFAMGDDPTFGYTDIAGTNRFNQAERYSEFMSRAEGLIPEIQNPRLRERASADLSRLKVDIGRGNLDAAAEGQQRLEYLISLGLTEEPGYWGLPAGHPARRRSTIPELGGEVGMSTTRQQGAAGVLRSVLASDVQEVGPDLLEALRRTGDPTLESHIAEALSQIPPSVGSRGVAANRDRLAQAMEWLETPGNMPSQTGLKITEDLLPQPKAYGPLPPERMRKATRNPSIKGIKDPLYRPRPSAQETLAGMNAAAREAAEEQLVVGHLYNLRGRNQMPIWEPSHQQFSTKNVPSAEYGDTIEGIVYSSGLSREKVERVLEMYHADFAYNPVTREWTLNPRGMMGAHSFAGERLPRGTGGRLADEGTMYNANASPNDRKRAAARYQQILEDRMYSDHPLYQEMLERSDQRLRQLGRPTQASLKPGGETYAFAKKPTTQEEIIQMFGAEDYYMPPEHRAMVQPKGMDEDSPFRFANQSDDVSVAILNSWNRQFKSIMPKGTEVDISFGPMAADSHRGITLRYKDKANYFHIRVASNLTAKDKAQVLAHELGHLLLMLENDTLAQAPVAGALWRAFLDAPHYKNRWVGQHGVNPQVIDLRNEGFHEWYADQLSLYMFNPERKATGTVADYFKKLADRLWRWFSSNPAVFNARVSRQAPEFLDYANGLVERAKQGQMLRFDNPTVGQSFFSEAADDVPYSPPAGQMGFMDMPAPEAPAARGIEFQKMDIDEIQMNPESFQRRALEGDAYNETKARHMAETWNWPEYQPISVWRNPESGVFEVLAGHHRLAAMKMTRELNPEQFRQQVDVKVMPPDMDFQTAQDLAVKSNLDVGTLGLQGESNAVLHFHDQGMSAKQIANELPALGKASKVEQILHINAAGPELFRLADLDPSLQPVIGIIGKGVFDGRYSVDDAMLLWNHLSDNGATPPSQVKAQSYVTEHINILNEAQQGGMFSEAEWARMADDPTVASATWRILQSDTEELAARIRRQNQAKSHLADTNKRLEELQQGEGTSVMDVENIQRQVDQDRALVESRGQEVRDYRAGIIERMREAHGIKPTATEYQEDLASIVPENPPEQIEVPPPTTPEAVDEGLVVMSEQTARAMIDPLPVAEPQVSISSPYAPIRSPNIYRKFQDAIDVETMRTGDMAMSTWRILRDLEPSIQQRVLEGAEAVDGPRVAQQLREMLSDLPPLQAEPTTPPDPGVQAPAHRALSPEEIELQRMQGANQDAQTMTRNAADDALARQQRENMELHRQAREREQAGWLAAREYSQIYPGGEPLALPAAGGSGAGRSIGTGSILGDGGTPPPGRPGVKIGRYTMPMLPSVDELLAAMRIEGAWQQLADAISSRWPALVRWINASGGLANATVPAKAKIALEAMREEMESLTAPVFAQLDRIGSEEAVFGAKIRSGTDRGKVRFKTADGQEVRVFVQQIQENRSRYQLSERQIAWLDTALKIDEAPRNLLNAYGERIGLYEYSTQYFTGRLLVKKENYNGDLLDLGYVPMEAKQGIAGTATVTKHRAFDSIEEALAEGFSIEPSYHKTMVARMRSAGREAVNIRMGDWILSQARRPVQESGLSVLSTDTPIRAGQVDVPLVYTTPEGVVRDKIRLTGPQSQALSDFAGKVAREAELREANVAVRVAGKTSDVLRFFLLTADPSVLTIQALMAWSGHPLASGRPFLQAAKEGFQALKDPEAVAQARATRIDDFAANGGLDTHRRLILDYGGQSEFTRFAQGGVRGVPFVGEVFARFGLMFDHVRDMMAVGLAEITDQAANARQLQGAERQAFIDAYDEMHNKMLGRLRMGDLGIGSGQRSAEAGFLALAPQYYRSTVGLATQFVEGGVRGQAARKVLAKSAGIFATTIMAANYASYRIQGYSHEDALGAAFRSINPTSGDFRTLNLGGFKMSLGGSPVALLALAMETITGEEFMTGQPAFRTGFSGRMNNLLRFGEARQSPAIGMALDAVTKEDFMGNNTNIFTREGIQRQITNNTLPVGLQAIIDEWDSSNWAKTAGMSFASFAGFNARELGKRDIRERTANLIFGEKNYRELPTWTKNYIDSIAAPDLQALDQQRIERSADPLNNAARAMGRAQRRTDREQALLELGENQNIDNYALLQDWERQDHLEQGYQARISDEYELVYGEYEDDLDKTAVERAADEWFGAVNLPAGPIRDRALAAFDSRHPPSSPVRQYIDRQINQRRVPHTLLTALSNRRRAQGVVQSANARAQKLYEMVEAKKGPEEAQRWAEAYLIWFYMVDEVREIQTENRAKALTTSP